MSEIFKNDSYSFEIDERPGCRIKANVTISPLSVSAAHKKALRFLKKDMTLPGFRKGKVPDETVIATQGHQLVNKRAQFLVDDAYKALLEFSKIIPLSQKSIEKIEILELDLDAGARVAIEYESRPRIPEVIWHNVLVPEEDPLAVVTEEDLEKGLEEIRFFLSDRVSVDTPSQEGDYISLSLLIGNEHGEEKSIVFENKLFKLCEEDMTPVFKDRFLGVKKADTIVDLITHPELSACLKGNTLTFIVNDVFHVKLPDLNDAMAQSLKADSLADLKAKLKIQLENRKTHENYVRRVESIENALAEAVDFDLPEKFFEEKCEDFRRERLIHLRLVESLNDEEILARDAEIQNFSKKAAAKFLKLLFLTQHIFVQEQLKYSKEELQNTIETCSRERFGNGMIPKQISQDEIRELVDLARERLVYRKAIETALDKARKINPATAAI